jgi:hypothetical protein
MSRDENYDDGIAGDNTLSSYSDELNEEYFTNYVPDCLVLKIIEYEKFNEDMDQDTLNRYKDLRVFILYDVNKGTFIIRGKRRPTTIVRTLPFSYECSRTSDVMEFIRLLVPSEHVYSIELYNATDLPTNSNEITYKKLCKLCKMPSMIIAYDNENINDTQRLSRTLYSLRHVYNLYSPIL